MLFVLRWDMEGGLPEPGRWGDEWNAPLIASACSQPSDVNPEEADQIRSGSTSQVQALAVGCVCVMAADRADVGVQSAGGGKCLLPWAVFKQAINCLRSLFG